MTFSPEEIRFSMQACAIGLSAAILGCDAPTSATPEEPISAADTTGPVINNVVLNHNPNPTVPLAAILSLSTDEPAEVTVRVEDGERVWDAISSEQPATEHSLIVLGLRAGRTHSITAVAVDASGNTSNSRALALETPPLPDAVPRPEVLISQPGRMEPGVTLFNVIRTGDDGEAVPDYRMLVIVDDQGEVIWYYRDYHGATDARRLSNGNILYLGGDHRAAEIDMLGNVIQAWHSNQADPETIMPGSIHVDTATFHHEVAELPSGNLLTLGRSARVIDDFPSSESDPNAAPAPATVVGDTIVEFTRDGTVVHEWSLLEILDPYRIGYGSLRSTFPPIQQHYNQPGEPIARDWTHSNAVSHDPSDDSFIVSVRYQDAVVKLDRQTGALKWILGTHDHWKEPWQQYLLEPQGDLEWQYHEHGPEVTGDGSIVMFDNGNGRTSAFGEELPQDQRYSRAVEFSVDEDAMTVTQEWDYGGLGEEFFYSSYISDADWLPVTGNVLVTDGGRRDDENGMAAEFDSGGRPWAQIFEVTRTEPAEKVFHIVLQDEAPAGYQVYRAQRLPSLYPE